MYPGLISCLTSLSPEVRRRIAAHHGLKEAEPETLARRLTDPVHLRYFLERMDSAEREGMRFFLFHVGEGVCAESGLRERENALSLPPARFRMALIRLRQWGFLYGLRRKWGETVYWCPPEVRTAWLDVSRKGPPLLPPATGRIRCRETGGRGVWHALFHFLVLCDRQPIPLTREGEIHRRWRKKLEVELEEWEGDFEDTPWAGRQEPASVRLVRDLARLEGLVRERGGVLEVDSARLDSWLSRSWKERFRRLYDLTRFRLLESRPDWDAMARLMEAHRSEEWVAVSTLLEEWASLAGRGGGRIQREAVVRHWLKPLCRLGWIELASSSRGILWRWTPFAPAVCRAAEEETGMVQPDFEVLIPPFFPLDRRWQLACFADYAGGDHLLVYRIHADSVARARERGMKEEEMLALLEQIAGGRVPANVAAGIRQWCRRVGRIALRQALLVEAEDGELIDELERIPELRDLIVERVGSRVLIADQSREKELRDRLKKMGYPPRSEEVTPQATGADPAEEGEGDAVPEDFVVENRYPDLTEAVPGARNLPRMWTSGIRSYHPATVQDMVRKAIQLRLELRVQEKNGTVRRLTPRQLENRAGAWTMEGENGGRRVRIELDRIRGLQIRLPE
ncbi:Helicase conserved C-terminal domain-containing protein [Planifilum fulgidum]|uniref:Helicase conserved C-terminal domain-containing protein n=1 Tax=Planifilum fulgidum TaxID=201973 RepID=A0A1I2MUY1_9BACL|nr:helicase-associated domain-containing protein [Planifilum fulgidum]SFF92921.1 Helicase conserved C-terminal domain-containing protein [Planifilum fulgidum]